MKAPNIKSQNLNTALLDGFDQYQGLHMGLMRLQQQPHWSGRSKSWGSSWNGWELASLCLQRRRWDHPGRLHRKEETETKREKTWWDVVWRSCIEGLCCRNEAVQSSLSPTDSRPLRVEGCCCYYYCRRVLLLSNGWMDEVNGTTVLLLSNGWWMDEVNRWACMDGWTRWTCACVHACLQTTPKMDEWLQFWRNSSCCSNLSATKSEKGFSLRSVLRTNVRQK